MSDGPMGNAGASPSVGKSWDHPSASLTSCARLCKSCYKIGSRRRVGKWGDGRCHGDPPCGGMVGWQEAARWPPPSMPLPTNITSATSPSRAARSSASPSGKPPRMRLAWMPTSSGSTSPSCIGAGAPRPRSPSLGSCSCGCSLCCATKLIMTSSSDGAVQLPSRRKEVAD